VSYLIYPNFETDPHPALLRTVKLSLRTQEIDRLENGRSVNPPIFHRKEALLAPDDPRWAKFARLTAQEERAELLAETASIGARRGWTEHLLAKGYTLRGHRLIRSRPSHHPSSP
jgi:DNA phosphorothioation-associated putative methyltransferase